MDTIDESIFSGVIEVCYVTILSMANKGPIPERVKMRVVELIGSNSIGQIDKYKIVFNRRLPDYLTRELGGDLGIEFPELVTKGRNLFRFNHKHPAFSVVKGEENE